MEMSNMNIEEINPSIKREWLKWDDRVDQSKDATWYLKKDALNSISNIILDMHDGDSIMESLVKWKVLSQEMDKWRRG